MMAVATPAMFPVPMGDGPEARAMVEQRVLHYPDVLRDALAHLFAAAGLDLPAGATQAAS